MKNDVSYRLVLICSIFAFLLVLNHSTGYSSEKNRVGPKIEGLYLGMDIKDAKIILESLYQVNFKINSPSIRKNAIPFEIDHWVANVKADKNGSVYFLSLGYAMFDMDAKSFVLDEFAQSFMKTYNIPKMKREELTWNAYQKIYMNEYTYVNTEQGYKVKLGEISFQLKRLKRREKKVFKFD